MTIVKYLKLATILIMASVDSVKEQILTAALDLMNSMGYGSLTISELARQSGISKQRLYYHYPSLEEVLVVLAERWSQTGQICALDALARTDKVGPMKILAISEGMFDWMENFNKLSRLALVLYQSSPQVRKLDSFMEAARSKARERIKYFLVQDETFRKMSKPKIEKVVTAIHSLLYGFGLYVMASNEFANITLHRKNCAEALTRLIESYSNLH